MQVHERVIQYKSRRDEFHLYPIGDEHLGTIHCAESKLIEQHKIIKNDPLALWIGMGDKAEAITPSDPRWDSNSIASWLHQDNIAEDEANRYIEIVSKYGDTSKCLGLLTGNHEESIRRHSHSNIHTNICKRLNLPDLDYSAFIRLVFRRGRNGSSFEVVIYATHGAGAAITKGAKLNRLQRVMSDFESDITLHGHMHDVITDTRVPLGLNRQNEIKAKRKVGAITGCWFRTYTQGEKASYGEIQSFPPTVLGCPVFTIIPDKGEIKVQGV